ncbi:MAG TPA: hypothetical protein VF173_01030 [Thermoanaerobaculia bacterium]|nr:hypothetical protein [Thermoanaerobaculia bacterium]
MATTIDHSQQGFRMRWLRPLGLAGLIFGSIVALLFGAPVQTLVGLLLIAPILSGMAGAARSRKERTAGTSGTTGTSRR